MNRISKARNEWMDSEQGKLCTGGTATGKWLQNRVELAFLAGYQAAERNIYDHFESKIKAAIKEASD